MNFSEKMKAFFSQLWSSMVKFAKNFGNACVDTWENLRVDLKVFVNNIKNPSKGNDGQHYPRVWVEGGEPMRDGDTVRTAGAKQQRPKIHIDETVRAQYVPGEARETVRSQTRSKYDEDYKRRKKDVPKWWKITGGILKFILRAVATVLLICVMTGCIVGATAMIYVLAFLDKDIDFDLYNLKMSYTSAIYVQGDDGQNYVFQELHGSENRIWVDYENIPEDTRDAFVAIEDKRYWTHSGVDWRRTIFAFGNMFLHLSDDNQGGSTITQQLIKNVTEEDEVSIERKLKEIFRALELERKYSKKTILESYMNVIALGNGCNGVQAAANTYFDKDVSELTLAESCCIAGITKNPSKYNPLYHPENNKDRAHWVLKEMLNNGFITQEEYDQAYDEITNMVYNENARYNPETKSYNNWYVDQIIYELREDLQTKAGMSETEAKLAVYNGGLQIYSCMDLKLQNKVDELFANASNFKKFPKKTQPQCAIVVMNYKGEVKALSGGRGTKTQDLVLNRATQSQRQPGSSMKPLAVYGPAVEMGYLEYSTPVTNSPSLKVNGKNWPKNSGYASYTGKNIPVAKGIEISANCVAVRISTYIGYSRAFDFMTERLGLTLVSSRTIGGTVFSDKNPSTCLGALTDGVTVLEMTAAYATFGNGGKLYEPIFYTKVYDADGNLLIDNTKNVPIQAFSKDSATIMNRLLRTPISGSNGTAKKAKLSGHAAFGKTGTTSDNKDRYFAGGTAYYVSACWFGYDIPAKLEITSPNHAMMAWKMVMQAAHKGLEGKNFENMSSNIVPYKYCASSGGLASASCPSTATGYFHKKTKMPVCPVHGGGVANDAYTRFITNKSSFATGDSETEESEDTTVPTSSSTTPPPIITTDPTTSSSNSTTQSTSSSTTESTTKSTTESTTESTTKSTTESTTESTTKSTTESTTESTTKSTTEPTTTTTTTKAPPPPEPDPEPQPEPGSEG